MCAEGILDTYQTNDWSGPKLIPIALSQNKDIKTRQHLALILIGEKSET